MKPLITLLVLLCVVQKSEARICFVTAPDQMTARLLFENFNTLIVSTIKSRPTFRKGKLLNLLLKLKKRNSEDTEKRKNRLLGKVSAVFGGLSLVSMILTIIFASGFTLLTWFVLPLLAIILGLIALRRSKKFSDTTNSGRKEAMVGIILGSVGLAAFIIWSIIELS